MSKVGNQNQEGDHSIIHVSSLIDVEIYIYDVTNNKLDNYRTVDNQRSVITLVHR
jgi:hypothetical protein